VADRELAVAERGAAAVEMAFAVVLLILLATGVADLGRALFTYIGVQDAAQEGAVFGSFKPISEDEIVARVVQSIDYPALTAANVDVSCPAGSPNGGHEIAVEVTFTVDLMTPIIGQLLGGSIDLSKTSVGETFLSECLTP